MGQDAAIARHRLQFDHRSCRKKIEPKLVKPRSASNGSSTARQRAFGFAGEESAGASFLKRDGSCGPPTRRRRDGLLAAEILAKTGRDPSQLFAGLTMSSARRSMSGSTCGDADAEERAEGAWPDQLGIKELAGDAVRASDQGAGNDQSFGGIKVETDRAGSRHGRRHRGRLQDLRRELSRHGSSEAYSAGRQGGDREGVLIMRRLAAMLH